MGAEEGSGDPASSFPRTQLLPHHDGPLQHALAWQRKEDAGRKQTFNEIQVQESLVMGHCRLVCGVWGVERFMDLAKHPEARIHNRKNSVREEVQQGDWQWV